MVDKLHAGVLTSFTGGELTPQLAGRVDKEEMKIGSRYVSNFIPEHQGGLKKFYGSTNVTEITEDLSLGYRMIPFDGCGEPLCLLFVPGKVYCVTRNEKYEVDIQTSFQTMLNASYVQVNDVMYVTNENTKQFVITYNGMDLNTGMHTFSSSTQNFVIEPFFPLNWQGNYNGLPLHTSGSVGDITITADVAPDYYSLNLPDILKDCGTGKNMIGLLYNDGHLSNQFGIVATCNEYRNNDGTLSYVGSDVSVRELSLIRVRANAEELIKKVQIGSIQLFTGEPSNNMTLNPSVFIWIVSNEHIVNAFNSVFDNTAYIANGEFRFTAMPTGHQSGDLYYFKIYAEQGDTPRYYECLSNPRIGGYIGIPRDPGYTQQVTAAAPEAHSSQGFDSVDVAGRKIKISMNPETSGAGVKSWAEGITVSAHDIVYSDGHYYECMVGGVCGQTQPTHTQGVYSDGKCSWLYLHSGYGYITITSVEDDVTMYGHVDSMLPFVTGTTDSPATEARSWNNYQWSMWGYKNKYPNQVFTFNGRLGYTLDTAGYGSWLQLSKADEFDDFGVEDFGEVTDICAINTLISEYNENRINWVISGYRLYMGSYAGEYNISGGDENKSVITPSNCNILPVSQAGGGPVKATKFEDLNLFASADRKQIFSLKYDYTSDDYIPDDIGFAGEDLLTSGISSMWHLRGHDRNLYLRTEDNSLVLINQPEDVKALGFFRINMLGDVLDHCVSNSNGVSSQFVLIKRGNVYTVEFVEPDYQTYMLNTKRYVPATGETYVSDTITETMFANKDVYVCDNNTGEFYRQHIGASGVITNSFETTKLSIGIEMPCEVHTHPLYNDKFETAQQKSVRYTIRVVDSGAFSYGSSNNFGKWYDYNNNNIIGDQEYGEAHKLMTGDIKLPSSFGYQQAQNKADSKYPNDSAVALSLKAVTPEPFNLLLVSSIYV